MDMKKLMAFVALVGGMLMASGENVYSSNMHTYARVDSVYTNTIVAVPWTFYTPDGSATTNLPVDRLVRPQNLTTGDMLMVLTNNATYATWQLTEQSGVRAWTEVATVQRRNDAEARSDVFTDAHQNMAMARGYGLWLYRQNPLDADGKVRPFYVMGQWVNAAPTVTLAGGSEDAPAFTMLANPTPGAVTSLNSLAWDWDKVGATDTVIIPTDRNQVIYCFRLNTRRGGLARQWCYAQMTTGASGGQQTTYVTDITVPPNTGFWFVRRSAGNLTLQW